jgi:pimeloyl-ACP methyl ester carboxylesterase
MAASTPLAKMEYSGGVQSKTLVIFLPGIDDLAEDFERRGIIADMRQYGITADAIAVDAHYGYYAEEIIFQRITDDVIVSARRAGYAEIWLAGISLGGFGASLYAARHAADIDGLMLFAPYLGDDTLIQEIADAGGTRNWEPGHIAEGDYPRSLWAWFKHHLAKENPALPIYLGYGISDKFARANALLARELAQHQIFAIPGKHNWRTWKKIWKMLLPQWNKGFAESPCEPAQSSRGLCNPPV